MQYRPTPDTYWREKETFCTRPEWCNNEKQWNTKIWYEYKTKVVERPICVKYRPVQETHAHGKGDVCTRPDAYNSDEHMKTKKRYAYDIMMNIQNSKKKGTNIARNLSETYLYSI